MPRAAVLDVTNLPATLVSPRRLAELVWGEWSCRSRRRRRLAITDT
ncbi:hypothetical protein ABT294_14750 [Nonomuraea sp. NPDC000554]